MGTRTRTPGYLATAIRAKREVGVRAVRGSAAEDSDQKRDPNHDWDQYDDRDDDQFEETDSNHGVLCFPKGICVRRALFI